MIGFKRGIVVFLAALACVVQARVIELTTETFEHLTQASTGATTGDWFVMFYSDKCSHCLKAKPEWEALGEEMLGRLNVAKVNAREEEALKERFGVKGYPTFYYFSKGRMYRYTGQRTVEKFKRFATLVHTQGLPDEEDEIEFTQAELDSLNDGVPVPDEPSSFSLEELVKEPLAMIAAAVLAVLAFVRRLLSGGKASKRD